MGMTINPTTRATTCFASTACQKRACISFRLFNRIEILTWGILRSPNLFHRSSMVYRPTRAVQKKPTHLTLQTHPILKPVRNNQVHHSNEKLARCRRWNLAQHIVVVKVKQSSMESNRMKREMVAYEFSHSTIRLISQTVALRKFNSRAV